MGKLFKYNSAKIRWALYVVTAFFVSLHTGMQGYKTFSEIGLYEFTMILISSAIQGLIAWRAFIDESLQKAEAKESVTIENFIHPPEKP